MSIKNYVRPQLTIKQLLDRTPDRLGDHINTLVIGAEYFLNIYDEADIPGETYTAAGGAQTLDFKYFDELGTPQLLDHDDYDVDGDSVKIFAEELEAVVATFAADGLGDTNQFTVVGTSLDTLNLTELNAGNVNNFVRGATVAGELDGRNVAVGDSVRITDENGVVRTRKVIGFASATNNALELNRLVLDGPAVGADYTPAQEVAVEIFLVWSGELTDFDWTTPGTPSDGIELATNQSLQVTDKDTPTVVFSDNTGTVFLSYRALETPAAGEGVITVDSVTDITDNLGMISLHNDIAFAANEALSGSQGKPVKVLKVASDDLAGYTAALRKIETTDMVYALVPVTTDFAAIEAVVQHAETMSNEVNKKFRRVYFGTDSPSDYIKASLDSEGAPILIDVDPAGGAGPITEVTTASPGVNFLSMGLVKGDFIVEGANTYTIEEVIDATTLLLDTALGGAIAGQDAVFWKADTPQSQIDYVADLSKSLGSRRAANIWTEGGTRILNGETTSIPNRFLAAEVAGLRSALLPQQGLTRTEINSITDAPDMYIRYTPELLDELAANGVFIVTQEVENGDVFIRHQLTTDVDNGSLYYEDNVGTNIDDISYEIKDTLDGYIGRRNVNTETIVEINGKMFALLKNKTLVETSETSNIGPALIGFEDLVVEADDILKDKIKVFAKALVPLPLNNIEVTLQGSVAVNI